jgi:predicted MFS family arabinose efflux permease
MGFVTAGALLGPAIGPVMGGILAQFLGWRAIFWFLVILAASFLFVFAIFFPETGRHGGLSPMPQAPDFLQLELPSAMAPSHQKAGTCL